MTEHDEEELPEALRGMDEEELEEAKDVAGPGKKRVAPEGKYRVLGTDTFSPPTDPDWVVGDFDSKEEALETAREKNEAAGGLDADDEMSTMICRYYAYDDEGNYIGGDIRAGE